MQRQDAWEQFRQHSITQKLPYFIKDNRLFDIIYAQQFNPEFLSHLFCITDNIRTIAQTPKGKHFLRSLLADKRTMLFFIQPSTRTFMSFLNACQLLGMQTSDIRDIRTSSEVKGESQEDSIQAFSSYVDLIITRHPNEGFAEQAAWLLNHYGNRSVPVINGGSGKDQHPTQALLDIYTISQAFDQLGGIGNKTYAMIGDLKRGRTARSLCYLLALYPNVRFYFISPKAFTMQSDILEFLDGKNIPYIITEDFNRHIGEADAIYATRIQDEYNTSSESSYPQNFEQFHITSDTLSLLKKHCIILHPLPRRDEISTDIDTDPRALYWNQVHNGMWIRAALMLYLFKRDELVAYYVP